MFRKFFVIFVMTIFMATIVGCDKGSGGTAIPESDPPPAGDTPDPGTPDLSLIPTENKGREALLAKAIATGSLLELFELSSSFAGIHTGVCITAPHDDNDLSPEGCDKTFGKMTGIIKSKTCLIDGVEFGTIFECGDSDPQCDKVDEYVEILKNNTTATCGVSREDVDSEFTTFKFPATETAKLTFACSILDSISDNENEECAESFMKSIDITVDAREKEDTARLIAEKDGDTVEFEFGGKYEFHIPPKDSTTEISMGGLTTLKVDYSKKDDCSGSDCIDSVVSKCTIDGTYFKYTLDYDLDISFEKGDIKQSAIVGINMDGVKFAYNTIDCTHSDSFKYSVSMDKPMIIDFGDDVSYRCGGTVVNDNFDKFFCAEQKSE